MARERTPIFDEPDDLDVSSFKPKAGPDPHAASAETIRAVAEASNFPSRQAVKAAPEPVPAPAAVKRQPRRHRTGRTVQLNARTTQKTVDGFYAIADAQHWLVGETIEHALAALQRELAGQGRGPSQL